MLSANAHALLAEKEAENDRLRKELARLGDELARVVAQLRAAHERNVRLSAQLAQLGEAVAKGNDQITELLAIAQRKKGRASPPPKEPPIPPAVTGEAATAFDGRPRPPDPPGPVYDHPRQKFSPTGRKPLPAHLEVDESTVYPERCRCGCTTFDWVDEIVETKLDVRPHQRRRITHRKVGRCRHCSQPTTAEAPPSPFQRSKVTCEWLAWLVVQKFQLAVPLDRVRRYLGAQGVALSMSFLVSMVERAAELLDPIDGEHWNMLRRGDHLASDGTGFKVQVPGVGLHHGFLEVYHWQDAVVFQYEPEKGGQTQAGKLQKFRGTLLVDAESRYNLTFKSDGIEEAGCNAHGRRKFRDAEEVQPVLAAEGGRFVSSWFEADEAGRAQGLRGEALLQWRQAEIAPLVTDFRTWMDAVLPKLVPDDPVAKVIRYYRNHWQALTRFLSDPELPLDNSASEREFQLVAKIRLNSLFAGGTEGAHRAAVLLGISATCRRLKVDLQAYLTWVFVRVGTHRSKYGLSATDLTPAAYARAHPRASPG